MLMPLDEAAKIAALYAKGGTRAIADGLGISMDAARRRLTRTGIPLDRGGRRPGHRLMLAVDLLAVYREAGVKLTVSTVSRWCERPTSQVRFVYASRYGIGSKRKPRPRKGKGKTEARA